MFICLTKMFFFSSTRIENSLLHRAKAEPLRVRNPLLRGHFLGKTLLSELKMTPF